MKDILIDISAKIGKSYIDAIKEIREICGSLAIPFFIVGALARDFILEHFYGVRSPRRTTDIDLAVKVKSWKQFDDLINAALKSGKFKKQKEKQRLVYNDNVFIDIVPFGKISDKDLRISWPPEHETVMSVMGFDDVYKFSTTIRLSSNPPLEVKIPTLPGLAILKLLSWKDNYPERKKDAQDLLFIMLNYEHAGIFDRLYETEVQLLKNEDFDIRAASIKLLGKDMGSISYTGTLDYISKILIEETDEESRFNLVAHMMNPHDDFDKILNLLIKLKEGLLELLKP